MSKYTTDKVARPPYVQNDLRPELAGSGATNPFSGYNSSPRQSMLAKQMGQTLVIKGAEPRFIQTGNEREIGKYTFNKTFDNNSYIVAVIPKYPHIHGPNSIDYSPVKTVIFENNDDPTLELDVMYLEDHFSMHHYFGFRYKYNDNVLRRIKKGASVPAGTKVADSPGVDEHGDYAYGVNANVVLSSHPGGAEDGVIMSQSFAKKLTTTLYETREFTFGDGAVPLNIYGDDNNYKIFPDIGDRVREDGIICALREYIPELAPCDLSIDAVQHVTEFDKMQFAPPGSRVVDVTVMKGSSQPSVIFTGQEDQVMKYHDRHMAYYEEIRDVYQKMKARLGASLAISCEFHRLLVEAEAMLDDKITLKKKRNRLAPWTVTITVEYELSAENGFKITDTHGGKSVTVTVKPDEEMPVDKMGNVADLIVDDNSVIKRLIKGKLHEHYIAGSMRDTTHRLRDMAKKYKGYITDEGYDEMFEYLLGIYKIISPRFYDKFAEIQPDIKNHVDKVLEDGIYIWVPTDNPVSYMDVVKLLVKHYPTCNGPVEFVNHRGEKETTVNNVIIGQIYYMLLEKIANDYSAVSSAKLQHFGLPSKPSNSNKYDNPIKMTPVRFGESEYRLFVATVGGYETAEIADRSTNLRAHEEILSNMLKAEQPSNVYSLIDRNVFPIGEGFIQKIVHHEFACIGVKYE